MKYLSLILFIFILIYKGFPQTVYVEISPEKEYQTIHNFGASDAWSCQFVGNWPEKKKNYIADLLFSLENKNDGSPKGIGLSCWRFNIGAGSADQQTETKIGDTWRRAECFLQKDGTYNWEKQAGQRWFLQAAKNRGVQYTLAFVNSPPVWLTKNGRANSSGGNSCNLKKENFGSFSKFLIETTKNIHKNNGVLFDFISPINEPQWDWKGGQEGSPWKNNEIAAFCRILSSDLKTAGLPTQISIPDAGKLTHLFERGNDNSRGFQIEDFFSPGSQNFIGNLPNMAHKIAGHSYYTVKSDSMMNLLRSRLNTERQEVNTNLEFWMSEYCILGGNGILKGSGRDLGMETALFVANVIHSDLTVANASAWQWWLAVSPYNFKDGLVYIDKNKNDGNIYESKLLWTLGNYSRFIRPGAKRIEVKMPKDKQLKVSAFKNSNSEIIVVCINLSTQTKSILLEDVKGIAKKFETSEKNNLRFMNQVNLNRPQKLSEQSVSTFVITP